MGIPEKGPLAQLSLPPGFRFYPTDEELLVQYLLRKVAGHHFDLQIIGEVDLYKFDPWVLPSKATFGEKEWYFFSPRDRKYPNGSRPNRVAGSGYWKATGTDKVITTQGRKVGIKKALVFYVGKAPKGTKTNWIMHEYRLLEPSRKNGSSKLDDWVLCRIYKKNSSSSSNSNSSSTSQNPLSSKEHSHGSSSSSSSHLDDMLESLPEINDPFLNLPRMPSLKNMQNDEKFSLQHMGSGNFDWASLLSISTLQELNKNNSSNNTRGNQTQTQTQFQGQQQVGGFNQTTDVYVPSIPPLCHVDSPNGKLKLGDEEVQSGISPSQVNNSGFFQQNSGLLTQCFNNPVVDQFGFRYPSQSALFAFRQ